MAQLAAVIAEYTLDNNAANWFKLPWRDGWNAIELAERAADRTGDVTDDGWLHAVCDCRLMGPDVYWIAQDRLSPVTTPCGLLRAGLRCLQVMLAKSDGGGEVYNAILLGAFSSRSPEIMMDLVLEYRCRDSIGTTAVLCGDRNDRLRRAFTTAWKRGLYLAAYSLPPATVVLKVAK
jgi:hypothetical protein